ncbi:hypothetical protein GLYMA_16G063050v4 [Glycine max]|nr:hypothetical protein GLYMA_16G063050v4 [Glycine max]KAH1150237.1 hypothetical protein GYH30_044322 [Glycine max]
MIFVTNLFLSLSLIFIKVYWTVNPFKDMFHIKKCKKYYFFKQNQRFLLKNNKIILNHKI